MWNKRKHERKNPTGTFRVYDRYNNRYIGILYNMSASGLMISSERPMSKEQIYHLRIDLPREFENRRKINLDAECRWCKRNEQDTGYNSGLEFSNIPESDNKLVDLLLHSWNQEASGIFGNNVSLDD